MAGVLLGCVLGGVVLYRAAVRPLLRALSK